MVLIVKGLHTAHCRLLHLRPSIRVLLLLCVRISIIPCCLTVKFTINWLLERLLARGVPFESHSIFINLKNIHGPKARGRLARSVPDDILLRSEKHQVLICRANSWRPLHLPKVILQNGRGRLYFDLPLSILAC